MSFTKLDSGIINSSIWSEPLATRVLWITLLSQCDEEGFVSTSLSGLKRSSNIPENDFNVALKTLLSPDVESRTRDNKGIRLIEVEGGFVVSNYKLYRDREYKEYRKDQVRKAVRRYRERNNEPYNQSKITGDNKVLPSSSASVSASSSESASKDLYFKTEKEAYSELTENKEWLKTQEKYHPNMNILLSLEKAHVQFWGTEAGWEFSKKKRSKTKNWKRTFENALSQRINQVWKTKDERNAETERVPL